jgi:hypothetical protein
MKKIKGNDILLIFVLFCLLLPFLENKFKITKNKPLLGYIDEIQTIELTRNSWFNDSFQLYYEKNCNMKFGFRNDLIRLNNEIAYSLFGDIKTNAVVKGKDNYIFNYDYLNAYLGLDFIGQERIDSTLYKLKKIQDTLKSQGQDLIIILNPGKASYCSEFIPSHWSQKKQKISNYSAYKNGMIKSGILFLDFRQWFLSMKKTSPYILYSTAGTHWNQYGEYLASDSLLKHIEVLKNKDLPDIILDSVKVRNYNNDVEYELAGILNINTRIPTKPMPQTYFHFNCKDKDKEKAIVISDSYYNVIWHRGLSSYALENGPFWYYFREFYSKYGANPKQRKEVDLLKELKACNTIVLLSSDVNLTHFGFGFIEDVYQLYFPTS